MNDGLVTFDKDAFVHIGNMAKLRRLRVLYDDNAVNSLEAMLEVLS